MKEKYPKIKLQRAKAVLHLVHRTWFSHLDWPTKFIEDYFGSLISSFSNRGLREGIKENKALRLKYTQWLSNPDTHPFPSVLKKWGVKESREADSIKVVLSILSVTRSLRLPVVPDLGVIEDPLSILNPLDKFREFLKVAIKPWMKKTVKSEWDEFHYSTKSGPNGQAMYTSFEDLSLLPPGLIQEIKMMGGQKMEDMLLKIFSIDDTIQMSPFELIRGKYKPRKSKEAIRRIAFIPDREGKTRTIGVLDYWSQTTLKPLHDSIMRVLRKLRADMTFRQEANLISRKGPYFSIDLKAATDSFPIELQEAVLSELIGPKAKIWKSIMTAYPFKAPHRVDPVYYKRGQPMGAYSSWAVFSLTHHLLIQFSASEVNKYPFVDYQVLGDDVVIADRDVGNAYLENLTRFNIPVSKEKTMISEEVYEFAKRWFINGTEVSPFPVSGIFEESKHYFTLRNLLYMTNKKGYPSFDNCEPNREFIMQIWDIFGKKSQKERLIKKLRVFNSIVQDNPDHLHKTLDSLYPKEERNPEFVKEIIKKSKLYMSMHDLLSLQEFYNHELDALKRGHVIEKYKRPESDSKGLATPAYEYADVWPPLNVARRLIRQYMRLLDHILKDHREECQLGDEAFSNALLSNEVPSFMISRQVINERTSRKKLGAKARLTGLIMSLWNERPDPNMNIKYLDQVFGVVIELDFDEWDECMGRVVLEPLSIREERLKNAAYRRAHANKGHDS
jgi:hypothetical protein